MTISKVGLSTLGLPSRKGTEAAQEQKAGTFPPVHGLMAEGFPENEFSVCHLPCGSRESYGHKESRGGMHICGSQVVWSFHSWALLLAAEGTNGKS